MTVLSFARLIGASAFLVSQAVAQTSAPIPSEGDTARKRPPRPDRVWVKDVEGTWMSQSFETALKSSRSPRLAAKKAAPIVIQLKKENGVYPILTTNFRSAVLHFMIEIEPDVKPNSWRFVTAKNEGIVNASEVTYSYFTGKRGTGGAFETLVLKEPHFAKRKATPFTRLAEPLETFVNRHTVAGKYKDAQGQIYEFTAEGDAVLPDRKFAYEVLLNNAGASCDVLTNHHEKQPDKQERIGFLRSNDQLSLYKVDSPAKGRYRCEDKPYVTLTRGTTT